MIGVSTGTAKCSCTASAPVFGPMIDWLLGRDGARRELLTLGRIGSRPYNK